MAKKEKTRVHGGKSLKNDLAGRIGKRAGSVGSRERLNPLAQSLSIKMKSKLVPRASSKTPNGPKPTRAVKKPLLRPPPTKENIELGELKIKNTSLPTLLRIHNLDKGTSVFDVRKIMEKVGRVRSVILKEFKRTSTAEIFFADEKDCPTAMKLLDGRKADGHILACGVATKSALLNKEEFEHLSRTLRKPFDGTVWDKDLS